MDEIGEIQNLMDMKIHEHKRITKNMGMNVFGFEDELTIDILRVYGGWIYTFGYDTPTSNFVPEPS